jgi:hypothetical protein
MTANEDGEALRAARDRLVMRWPSEPTDRKHIACLDRLIAELRSRTSIGPDDIVVSREVADKALRHAWVAHDDATVTALRAALSQPHPEETS